MLVSLRMYIGTQNLANIDVNIVPTCMYVTCIKSIMHLMHKEKTYLNDNLDTGFCVSFTLHIFPYQQYTMAEFLTFVQKNVSPFLS